MRDRFAISTHWNASRHKTGEGIVDEILELGIRRLELGYDLRSYHVDGIKRKQDAGEVRIDSVHNYCPVPPEATRGGPELYTLAVGHWQIHEAAIMSTTQTIQFAAEMGAKLVVMHCGNVAIRPLTPKLVAMSDQGERYTNAYEKLKLKLITQREKKVTAQLGFLMRGLERLIPTLEATGVRLGLEILPTYEAIPTEAEVKTILQHFGDSHLCYWHDFGHAQIRENLGFGSHVQSFAELGPVMGGMHIHDVVPTDGDHRMPPSGMINFPLFGPHIPDHSLLVLEPGSKVEGPDVKRGLDLIVDSWTET